MYKLYYMRIEKLRNLSVFLSRFLYREIKGTDKTLLTKQSFCDDPFFEIGKERKKKKERVRKKERERKKDKPRASSLISRFSRRQDVVSIYDPPKSRPPCQAPRVSLFCLSAHFCTFKTFFAANFIIRARVRTSRAASRAIRNEEASWPVWFMPRSLKHCWILTVFSSRARPA